MSKEKKEVAFNEWEKQRKFARETWESKYGPKMPWGTPLHGEWVGWEQGIIAGANWQKEQSATEAIEFAGWVMKQKFDYLAGKSYTELYELWKSQK